MRVFEANGSATCDIRLGTFRECFKLNNRWCRDHVSKQKRILSLHKFETRPAALIFN